LGDCDGAGAQSLLRDEGHSFRDSPALGSDTSSLHTLAVGVKNLSLSLTI